MGYFANGTEGEMFEEAWCSRCVHSDTSGEREIGVDPPCPVWMAHIMFAYEECNASSNAKAILDMLIEDHRDGSVFVNECQMFHPVDAGAAIPGQLRIEESAR